MKNNYKNIISENSIQDQIYIKFKDELKSKNYFKEESLEEIYDSMDSNKSSMADFFKQLSELIAYLGINDNPIETQLIGYPSSEDEFC